MLHFPANNKPYSGTAPELRLDLACYPGNRGDLTLYVLGHEWERLAEVPDATHTRKVLLTALDERNDLAESRFFRAEVLDACATEYVGLCSQSWDKKYRLDCRPIAERHRLHMRSSVVWAARTASPKWASDSDCSHPGMGRIIEEMAANRGIANVERESLWSNNFICHRDVALDLRRFWQAMFAELFSKYEWTPPYSTAGYDDSRHWSFLAERITMLYFAGRTDLRIRQLPC